MSAYAQRFEKAAELNMRRFLAEPLLIEEPKPGHRMEDGTVYAGTSPDTGRPMYTTRQDAPLRRSIRLGHTFLGYTFDEAAQHAAEIDPHGKHSWRVPTPRELDVLYKNRQAIGDFKTRGDTAAYWSSSRDNPLHLASGQDFRNGAIHDNIVDSCNLRVRYVCG
jgi:hypothetical protein